MATSPGVFQGVVVPTPSPMFQQQNYLQGPEQYQKIILTSAQLLALFTTPVVIAPAGGPGTILVPDGITYRYIALSAGAVAYTIGTGVLQMYLGSVAAGHALHASIATGLIDQTVNKTIPFVQLTTPTTFDTDANYLNQPLSIGNSVANYTLGNGSLEVMLEYYTLQV
jgi:hypothetical protein